MRNTIAIAQVPTLEPKVQWQASEDGIGSALACKDGGNKASKQVHGLACCSSFAQVTYPAAPFPRAGAASIALLLLLALHDHNVKGNVTDHVQKTDRTLLSRSALLLTITSITVISIIVIMLTAIMNISIIITTTSYA